MGVGLSDDFTKYATLTFNIRKCEKDEALEMLQGVSKDLGFFTKDIVSLDCFYMLADSALLFMKDQGDRIEMHIACPRRYRRGIKDKFISALKHLKENTGYREIYTTAPDDRVALTNMLKNLGFVKSGEEWVI